MTPRPPPIPHRSPRANLRTLCCACWLPLGDHFAVTYECPEGDARFAPRLTAHQAADFINALRDCLGL